MTAPSVALRVRVPLAALRVPAAREYRETFVVPPLATIYGMLLSYVGETQQNRHMHARAAVGMFGAPPQKSRWVRTLWRYKSPRDPGSGPNRRPDFQELCGPFDLALWVASSAAEQKPSLAERLYEAVAHPDQIERFSGLCLGESSGLVDMFRFQRDGDPLADARIAVPCSMGPYIVPTWAGRRGQRTRWARFRLKPYSPRIDLRSCYFLLGP